MAENLAEAVDEIERDLVLACHRGTKVGLRFCPTPLNDFIGRWMLRATARRRCQNEVAIDTVVFESDLDWLENEGLLELRVSVALYCTHCPVRIELDEGEHTPIMPPGAIGLHGKAAYAVNGTCKRCPPGDPGVHGHLQADEAGATAHRSRGGERLSAAGCADSAR